MKNFSLKFVKNIKLFVHTKIEKSQKIICIISALK